MSTESTEQIIKGLDGKRELKRIDMSLGHFDANGKRYFVEQGLSIERYTRFQRFELEMGFSVEFKKMFEELMKIYEYHQSGKNTADAIVRLHNLINGVKKVEEKEPYILKYCALVINREDEDRRIITDEMITRKIQDWQEEGIDTVDFFTLALRSLPGFIKIYQSNFLDILGAEAQEQKSQVE